MDEFSESLAPAPALLSCPVCGSSTLSKKFSIFDSGVFSCARCDFAFCHPLPLTPSESSGVHSTATRNAFSLGTTDRSDLPRARAALLVRNRYAKYTAAMGREHLRILEIGCGSARLGLEFEKCGAEYHGVDIDGRLVQSARAAGLRNIHHLDFLEMNLSLSFDVVHFSQVLEHIIEPRPFIKKVFHVLEEHGLVHIDVPNHESLLSTLRRSIPQMADRVLARAGWERARWGAILYPWHLRAYSRRAILELLSPYFDAQVFCASPSDATWGQIEKFSALDRSYYAISRWFRSEPLLVGFGSKKPRN